MKVDHTGQVLDYGFTVEVKCQCRAGLCPKPPSTFGEGHVCSKPAGHDDYDGLHHTCSNCGKDFNSLSYNPWAYKSMEDTERARLIKERLETPNVEVSGAAPQKGTEK